MVIQQPPDMSLHMPNGYFAFRWNKTFGPAMTERLKKTQKYIDMECMRLMSPYTPWKTSFLEKSVILVTIPGSGELNQIAPYARAMYYGKTKYGNPINYNKRHHPQAGKLWFERMKADHGKDIIEGAARIAGGIVK